MELYASAPYGTKYYCSRIMPIAIKDFVLGFMKIKLERML